MKLNFVSNGKYLLVNSFSYCILKPYKTVLMKKILNKAIKPEYLNFAILLLRLVVAAFMLTHGWPKLNRLIDGGEIKFGDPLGLGPLLSLILVVFAEFICSILVGLGLWTRLAVIPLIITMGVAAFVSHGGDPFARKELALMYLLIYVFLFVSGGGKYTLDKVFRKG